MHIFDYENKPSQLLTPEIVRLLTRIHEHCGAQRVLLEQYGEKLIALRSEAERQSDRAAGTRDEIYRDVLEEIREHFDIMAPSPELARAFHRRLFPETGGSFRRTDTVIRGSDRWGEARERFVPCAADRVDEAVQELFAAAGEAFLAERHDPLLLTAQFVIDFLSIHPFDDGNGRVVWLMQTLMLYRAGYYFNAYVSLERLIGQTEEAYQDALQYSSIFWQDGTNTYEPFVIYFLDLTLRACRQFERQTDFLRREKMKKADRIRDLICVWDGPIRKRQILEQYPDIAVVTVERALAAMVKEGVLTKTGSGPATAYVRIR